MSELRPDLLLADEDELEHPTPVGRVENPCHERRRMWHGFVTRADDDGTTQPLWAIRLSLAGQFFVAVGFAIILSVIATNPLQNLDVLSAGVTLALSGAVLRSITSPVISQKE